MKTLRAQTRVCTSSGARQGELDRTRLMQRSQNWRQSHGGETPQQRYRGSPWALLGQGLPLADFTTLEPPEVAQPRTNNLQSQRTEHRKTYKTHASGAISGRGWRISHTRLRAVSEERAAESQRPPKTKSNTILRRAE